MADKPRLQLSPSLLGSRFAASSPSLASLFDVPSRAPTLGSILAGHIPAAPSLQWGSAALLPAWIYCERRFRRFLANIEPTPNQHEDVETKAAGIIGCLNRQFWAGPPMPGVFYALIVGSWGKGTRARLTSDMDIMFLLPWAMYFRYEGRLGNKQSGILQEVKNALQPSYPNTPIRADGPTVILDFASYKVEIAPAFRQFDASPYNDSPDFRVMLCDTNYGGRYKPAAPVAEVQKIIRHNEEWNGDLFALIRMGKTWKRNCSVSFLLEQLAIEFLNQWRHTGKGFSWHAQMIRDFFLFMPTRQNGYSVLPASNEWFCFGNAWVSRAATAATAATQACVYERANVNVAAGEEWQKIFGPLIPREA
jgi:hypothetical protein